MPGDVQMLQNQFYHISQGPQSGVLRKKLLKPENVPQHKMEYATITRFMCAINVPWQVLKAANIGYAIIYAGYAIIYAGPMPVKW